jgi:hypothetical protein
MGGACSTHVWMKNLYKFSVGKPEGSDLFEDTGIDGRIILEWILGK